MNPEQEIIFAKIRDNVPVTVEVKGHRFLIHWIKRGQWNKMNILLCTSSKDDCNNKTFCKWFAMSLCNSFWLTKFYYPILWRYIYYVLGVDDNDRMMLSDAVYKMLFAPRGFVGLQPNLVLRKKLPWLFLSKKMLFGLITIPKWEYLWGCSIAQIELLCHDKLLINYREND